MTKTGLRYFDAFSLSVYRYLTAGAAMLVIVLVRREHLPKWGDVPLLFLIGMTGFTLYVLTFNFGSVTVPVATAGVVIATTPLVTAT